MKLKRYVKYDDGGYTQVVIEMDGQVNKISHNENEKGYFADGDKLILREEIEMGFFDTTDHGTITATSDNIFDLATPQWFTLDQNWFPLELAAIFNTNDDATEFDKEKFEKDCEYFKALYSDLFAPIYYQGKPVSYEKVYEKEQPK